jgi:DNA-binding transcriptional MerR regulator
MNFARKVLNGFSAQEVRRLSGLSLHMISYLAREHYLEPAYGLGRIRGRARYYSYRDLLVARIIAKLLASGVELTRLKKSIRLLSEHRTWFDPKKPVDVLATDGWKIYYHDRNGLLVELTQSRQGAFAFVLDVTKAQMELKRQLAPKKRNNYTLENKPLLFAPRKK